MNETIKTHYDNAMNSLKDKNYISAYNDFLFASNIAKIEDLKDKSIVEEQLKKSARLLMFLLIICKTT